MLKDVSNYVAKSMTTYLVNCVVKCVANFVAEYVVNYAPTGKGDGVGNAVRGDLFCCWRVAGWCRGASEKKRAE